MEIRRCSSGSIALSLRQVLILLNNYQIYVLLIFGIKFIQQFSKLFRLLYYIGLFINLFEFYRSVFYECCDYSFEETYLLDDHLNVHLFRIPLSIIIDLFVFAKAPKISFQKRENVYIKSLFIFFDVWLGLIWNSVRILLSLFIFLFLVLIHVLACLNFKGKRAVLAAYALEYGKQSGSQTAYIR